MTRTHLLIALAAMVPRFAGAQVVQDARGAADRFGPGFTALSEGRVDFQLTQPAHVALLWVTPSGSIELFYPMRSRDRSERRAGRHAINVSDVPSPIQPPELTGGPVGAQPGQVGAAGAGMLTSKTERSENAEEPAVSGYWVLVVTETPLTAPEVTHRLVRLSRDGGGPAVLDRVAAVLAPDPSTSAMYVAAVAIRP